MRAVLRLYAPVLVLLLWAVVIATVGLSKAAGVVAMITLAWAVKLQVDEARRQHSEYRRGRH